MANPLTFDNTPVFATGKFGQALQSGRARLPAAAIPVSAYPPASGTFTIEGFFRYTGSTSTTCVCGQLKGDGSAYVWYLGINNGQVILGAASGNANGPTISSTDNAWHHFALTYEFVNGTPVRLYIDGTFACSVSTGGNNGGYISLGWYNGGFDFAGLIDDVGLWNSVKYTGASFTPRTTALAGTESGLNALYRLDGDGTDSVGSSSGGGTTPTTKTIAANDASLSGAFSPYTWAWDGTSMNANSPHAYAKFGFSGTQLGLNLVALPTGEDIYPLLGVSIDNGPITSFTIASGATSVTFATGLSSGTHTVEFYLAASGGKRWAQTCAVKITGFVIDSGGAITTPTLRSKRAIWYGDSISEGYHVNADLSNDAAQAECGAVLRALDAEFGIIAYAGQGYTVGGNGDIPALSATYDKYASGVSRLVNGVLSPAPDYLIDMHGTNGNPSQSDIAAQIAKYRTIAPTARILMIVPPGGYARDAKTAATNAAIAAGDTNISLIDAGAAYQTGLISYGTPSRQAYDGLHPHVRTNMALAAKHSALIQHAIEPRKYAVLAA